MSATGDNNTNQLNLPEQTTHKGEQGEGTHHHAYDSSTGQTRRISIFLFVRFSCSRCSSRSRSSQARAESRQSEDGDCRGTCSQACHGRGDVGGKRLARLQHVFRLLHILLQSASRYSIQRVSGLTRATSICFAMECSASAFRTPTMPQPVQPPARPQ